MTSYTSHFECSEKDIIQSIHWNSLNWGCVVKLFYFLYFNEENRIVLHSTFEKYPLPMAYKSVLHGHTIKIKSNPTTLQSECVNKNLLKSTKSVEIVCGTVVLQQSPITLQHLEKPRRELSCTSTLHSGYMYEVSL